MLHAQLSFVPNHNQWSAEVLYAADIASGRAFFGGKKITYAYYSAEDIQQTHQHDVFTGDSLFEQRADDKQIRCYAYEVNFIGAHTPQLAPAEQKKHNVNYFIGNNPQQWAGNVPVYGKLTYHEIYPGIDVQYYGNKSQLKYDFIVGPGADAAQIALQYNGLRSLHIENENLKLDLGFMTLQEVIPLAYQLRHGVKEIVQCRFVLENNVVRFQFPDGFDASLPLIIDPEIIASTYSGGTCVTGGFCATYDADGNIYSAGDAFALGFPVTLGAYNSSFSGATDLAISKLNSDGSALLYCTYIGGFAYDFPTNLVVTDGKLYIVGATFSGDFPVSATAYDQVVSGICDFFVCCLDNTGSNLLASTVVGGTWGEGSSLLTPYYPDRLRAGLSIARNGDVLVCGSTTSTNFPATPGAFRTTTTGGQDAVVFRMNSTLTTLIWATYMGSGVHDIALDVQEAADGGIYVCGATNNMFTAFPTVSGCWNTTPMGGADAFLAKLSADGSTLIAGTLYGGSLLDAAFYLDIDKDGDVYICGISRKDTPVTDGVYFSPGAPNFVAKFNSSLTDLMYSTTIGAPSNPSNPLVGGVTGPVSPGPPSLTGPEPLRDNNNAITAFMVDNCERVYVGAYIGINRWPTTGLALFEYSEHNQFCILVLEEDAIALLSSTMYTGLHIDGGSGHFDDHGVLYQASCVGDTTFYTTPWAYSDGSLASVWDICVFKVDMYVDLIDSVAVPNVFTPNNDGINDGLGIGQVSTNFYDFTVYDRYGNKLYTTNDPHATWDGTFNGKECAEGVYFYVIRYHFCTELREKSGFVHLARGN